MHIFTLKILLSAFFLSKSSSLSTEFALALPLLRRGLYTPNSWSSW